MKWKIAIAVMVILGVVVIAALIAGAHAYYLPSGGMRPTIMEGDRVLANLLAYLLGEPHRGDTVVFAPPAEAMPGASRRMFIKRVIGLPGDTIQIRANQGAYVNGHKLKEPYIGPGQTADYDYGPVKVPDGQYFVLGDNRNDSNDSHRWGPLRRSAIRGKVWLRYSPANRIGFVR